MDPSVRDAVTTVTLAGMTVVPGNPLARVVTARLYVASAIPLAPEKEVSRGPFVSLIGVVLYC
jgi:hypothetical protein